MLLNSLRDCVKGSDAGGCAVIGNSFWAMVVVSAHRSRFVSSVSASDGYVVAST